MTRSKKSGILRRLLLAAAALLVLLQLVPYGHQHANPPVTGEPAWDRPETRETFLRVCGDCHSNETRWPWYSYVAPVSWLVQRDVAEGREHLNVSAWDLGHGHAHEAREEYAEGEMPLWFYTPLHPSTKLGTADREAFLAGLAATFGVEREGRGERRRRED